MSRKQSSPVFLLGCPQEKNFSCFISHSFFAPELVTGM